MQTIKHKSAKTLLKQVYGYSFASGLAFFTNAFSRNILDFWLSFNISIVISYAAGSLVKYSISKYFVFKKKANQKILSQLVRFIAVSLLGMLITYIISINFFSFLANRSYFKNEIINKNIAHLTGLCVGFFANFIGHKFFTFYR